MSELSILTQVEKNNPCQQGNEQSRQSHRVFVCPVGGKRKDQVTSLVDEANCIASEMSSQEKN